MQMYIHIHFEWKSLTADTTQQACTFSPFLLPPIPSPVWGSSRRTAVAKNHPRIIHINTSHIYFHARLSYLTWPSGRGACTIVSILLNKSKSFFFGIFIFFVILCVFTLRCVHVAKKQKPCGARS